MVEYDAQEHELVRKLDIHTFPLLLVMFICTNLIWNTVDQARTASFSASGSSPWPLLVQATDMKEYHGIVRYYEMWIPLAFALGFILSVIPLSVAMHKVYPSRWFGLGVVNMVTSSLGGFGSIFVAQFISGVLSAGLLPGILFYLTLFYIKEEYGVRVGLLVACADFITYIMATLVPSVLGTRSEPTPEGGMSAWRGMFLWNGGVTLVVGGMVWFVLPNHPSTALFLTPADQLLATQRVKDTVDPSSDPDHLHYPFTTQALHYEPYARLKSINGYHRPPSPVLHVHRIKEWIQQPKSHLMMGCVGLLMLANAIVTSRMPHTSAATQGSVYEGHDVDMDMTGSNMTMQGMYQGEMDPQAWWSPSAMVLSCIPKFTTLATTIALSFYADKKGDRAWWAALCLLGSAFSLFIMALVPVPGFRYYFLFIVDACLTASLALVLAYAMDHAQGDTTKRSVASGTVALYPLGKSIAHLLFPEMDSFTYTHDGGILSAAGGSALVAGLLLLGCRWWYRTEEAHAWSKTPGLRRLLNDTEEANAWEVDDTASSPDILFLKKSGRLTSRPIQQDQKPLKSSSLRHEQTSTDVLEPLDETSVATDS